MDGGQMEMDAFASGGLGTYERRVCAQRTFIGVCGAHGTLPPLNWPDAQAAHVPSVVASPVCKPFPGTHMVVVWRAHREESGVGLNLPVEHCVQAAGATTLFHSCPTGHEHFSAAQSAV